MKEDIEKLLEKYYEGETTLAEEKRLRDFFQNEPVPTDWQPHADLFRVLTEAQRQQPSPAFDNRVLSALDSPEQDFPIFRTTDATSPGQRSADTIHPSRVHPSRVRRLGGYRLQLAASVALLLIGFAGGWFVNNRWNTSSAIASAGQATPTKTMEKVLGFNQVAQTSASDRIQAINQSYELTQADQDITHMLINTLNFDENVNVRLASCQALFRFENEPGVREALIHSLKIQTNPHVQITLIEMLVAIKEKRVVGELQRLAKNQQVMEVVRLKAEEGLGRLVKPEKKFAS